MTKAHELRQQQLATMARRQGLPTCDIVLDLDAAETQCPACLARFQPAGHERCPACGLRFPR